MRERIAIVGLGYVGLPVALAFAEAYPGVAGFDVDQTRVEELIAGVDRTGEFNATVLTQADICFTADPVEIAGHTVYVVAVPTPIDQERRPDLTALERACATVGKVLQKGDMVVFESTVYPGLTEEICSPLLSEQSGMQAGRDFSVAYSPERINPGDRERTIARITKVVAGDTQESLERAAGLYGKIVPAGIHKAPSIKVAEAAKVIENTQRDLNIALMSELALIFDRLDIRTQDVLAAANTKWNFLPFTPGLVGGHCIGIDPYYLTAKAEAAGYHPEIILAGRRINDGMAGYVAQRMVKLLSGKGVALPDARVGVLGLTFKENVSDLRNSQVLAVVKELREFGLSPLLHDALADEAEVAAIFGCKPAAIEEFAGLDGLILAVPHAAYIAYGPAALAGMVQAGGVLIDVKSTMTPDQVPSSVTYWSL